MAPSLIRTSLAPDGSSAVLFSRRLLVKRDFRRLLSWLVWRYRYLGGFIIIGFLSILIEVILVTHVLPESWPKVPKSGVAFLAGLLFAFFMNAHYNFHVSRQTFLRTFWLFALISGLSYAVNLLTATVLGLISWASYPNWRFIASGCLFAISYYLHRRYTFRLTARNLGIAIHLDEASNIEEIARRVGGHCDHLHFDLVDETVDFQAPPVALKKIAEARQHWPLEPFCLHLMSCAPLRWIEQCWDSVDCFLVHVDIEDGVMEVISRCRQKGRLVGVVWHRSVTLGELLPYLPHVDYVMVLGIERPGQSGQKLLDEAIGMAATLDGLSGRYGYQLIFDGGVTTENVPFVRSRIIVSASGVLQAENPVNSAMVLTSGGYGP